MKILIMKCEKINHVTEGESYFKAGRGKVVDNKNSDILLKFNDTINFSGYKPTEQIVENKTYLISGDFFKDAKYGWSVKVKTVSEAPPFDIGEVALYLTKELSYSQKNSNFYNYIKPESDIENNEIEVTEEFYRVFQFMKEKLGKYALNELLSLDKSVDHSYYIEDFNESELVSLKKKTNDIVANKEVNEKLLYILKLINKNFILNEDFSAEKLTEEEKNVIEEIKLFQQNNPSFETILSSFFDVGVFNEKEFFNRVLMETIFLQENEISKVIKEEDEAIYGINLENDKNQLLINDELKRMEKLMKEAYLYIRYQNILKDIFLRMSKKLTDDIFVNYLMQNFHESVNQKTPISAVNIKTIVSQIGSIIFLENLYVNPYLLYEKNGLSIEEADAFSLNYNKAVLFKRNGLLINKIFNEYMTSTGNTLISFSELYVRYFEKTPISNPEFLLGKKDAISLFVSIIEEEKKNGVIHEYIDEEGNFLNKGERFFSTNIVYSKEQTILEAIDEIKNSAKDLKIKMMGSVYTEMKSIISKKVKAKNAPELFLLEGVLYLSDEDEDKKEDKEISLFPTGSLLEIAKNLLSLDIDYDKALKLLKDEKYKKLEKDFGTEVFSGLKTLKDNYKIFSFSKLIDVDFDKVYSEYKAEMIKSFDSKESSYLEKQKLIQHSEHLMMLFEHLDDKDHKSLFTNDVINKFIEEFEKKYELELGKQQKEAVLEGVYSPIFMLNGGAGTGKTTIVKCVLETLEKLSRYYKLKSITPSFAAPTGAAAQRLTVATGLKSYNQAKTIHSLLSWIPGLKPKVLTTKSNFVVFDEVSMLDLEMGSYVFEYAKKANWVLFVGDEEQLPPINAGFVLQDMIACEKINRIVLTETFRQKHDSHLLKVAADVRQGIFNRETFVKNVKDYSFLPLDNPQLFPQYAIAVYKNLMNEGANLFEISILSPVNGTDAGVNNLNVVIQNSLNYDNVIEGNKNLLMIPSAVVGQYIYKGDKVIISKNFPEIEVVNGDIGIINDITMEEEEIEGENIIVKKVELSIYKGRDEEPFILQFTSKDKVFSKIRLAYATTIHKSQGSEFDNIIIPLFGQVKYNPMLYKELIYTGVTRPKKLMILTGEESSWKYAITNKKIKKITGLGLLLNKTLE